MYRNARTVVAMVLMLIVCRTGVVLILVLMVTVLLLVLVRHTLDGHTLDCGTSVVIANVRYIRDMSTRFRWESRVSC